MHFKWPENGIQVYPVSRYHFSSAIAVLAFHGNLYKNIYYLLMDLSLVQSGFNFFETREVYSTDTWVAGGAAGKEGICPRML